MRTICILSRKGGTGKSTVSTTMAVASHLRGQKVLLADVDPQQSSHYSFTSRQRSGPAVEATCGGKLFTLKAGAQSRGIETLLIDTPAGLDAVAYQAVQVADFCLIVTRPNYLDIAAALTTINMLRQLSKPALIVINQAPPSRGGVEATATVKAREALRFARCPAAQTALCYRLAFARATALGQSVEETEPNSPAAKEVSALWDEIATAARLSGSLESLAPTRL